ncbi:uncharacterized protein E0L32_008528 [Thyridium curvatum]|uniref:Uncharacterized protein n=1 Tax=Thyridium curvatum TaxID=1093900 RepID=A0A507B0H6_9PEZI|nr:uncharacterized protein E0L32_008528 [Thyridium curvatum]TPX10478.1 hypothetical protein E0L32_008528 [Thyridium curvatum]
MLLSAVSLHLRKAKEASAGMPGLSGVSYGPQIKWNGQTSKAPPDGDTHLNEVVRRLIYLEACDPEDIQAIMRQTYLPDASFLHPFFSIRPSNTGRFRFWLSGKVQAVKAIYHLFLLQRIILGPTESLKVKYVFASEDNELYVTYSRRIAGPFSLIIPRSTQWITKYELVRVQLQSYNFTGSSFAPDQVSTFKTLCDRLPTIGSTKLNRIVAISPPSRKGRRNPKIMTNGHTTSRHVDEEYIAPTWDPDLKGPFALIKVIDRRPMSSEAPPTSPDRKRSSPSPGKKTPPTSPKKRRPSTPSSKKRLSTSPDKKTPSKIPDNVGPWFYMVKSRQDLYDTPLTNAGPLASFFDGVVRMIVSSLAVLFSILLQWLSKYF